MPASSRVMLTLLSLLCRHARPLWLREKLFWHTPAKANWPPGPAASLQFAPVTLRHLHLTDIGHRQLAWTGFYERELTDRLVALGRPPGGLLIDVGANAGYFTCLWAALHPHNEVWAFEPSPRTHRLLRRNVQDNALDARVRLFDCALGRETGEIEFDSGPTEQTGWGRLLSTAGPRRQWANGFLPQTTASPGSTPLEAEPDSPALGQADSPARAASARQLARAGDCSVVSEGPANTIITVACRRLDDLLPANAMVKALKIDTEGADTWVLFGAERLLRAQRIEHVFYERNQLCMSWLGIRPGDAEKFLRHLGYEVEPLKRGSDAEFHAWPKGAGRRG